MSIYKNWIDEYQSVIFIMDEAEFNKWLRHIASTGPPITSSFPKYLDRIKVCRVHIHSATIKKVRPKTEKRRKTTI